MRFRGTWISRVEDGLVLAGEQLGPAFEEGEMASEPDVARSAVEQFLTAHLALIEPELSSWERGGAIHQPSQDELA
jgi:hypothetical protein